MPDSPKKLSQFWQELKRRKVVRVITVYAAAAFVILELVDIITEPFGLPDWTLKLVVVLLCVGLIVSVILSWIYDIKPQGGIEKTQPAHELKKGDKSVDSNSWKIASYISFVVIVALIVLHLIPRSNKKEALEKSIAVLPFINNSPDAENEYFIHGTMEAILDNLAKIEDLRVVSLTSVLQYRGNPKPIPEIAKEMNVGYILEGSLQKDGDKIQLMLQLIDGVNDEHLWSSPYNREIEIGQIFNLQSEIAELVAKEIEAVITPEEKQLIERRPTDNMEAWDLYLKAKYEFGTYTNSGTNRGFEYMKQAIALDSSFAHAYSGLASGHIGRASMYSAELSALDAFAMAKPLIDKALALNPDLDEAHLWNGFYLLYNNWDFSGAEQEYKKAIVNDNPDALAVYVDLLNFTNRHQEALVISERLDQTNPYYNGTRMILSLYYVGEYETATEFAESRIELFNTYFTYDSYGFLLLNTSRYPKSIELFQKAIELNSVRTPRMLGWMGAAYAGLGEKEKSLELIEELKAMREQSAAESSAFFVAIIYSALEDKASALQWLQDAYENHEMEIPWLKSEPQFYPLHDEPEFQDILNKVGFPADRNNPTNN